MTLGTMTVWGVKRGGLEKTARGKEKDNKGGVGEMGRWMGGVGLCKRLLLATPTGLENWDNF